MSASESLTYDSAHLRLAVLEDAGELWHYRDLLLELVRRDLTVRYKRSALGFVWTMLNPLLTMLVLTLVFSYFFRFSLEHYPVYLLAGMLLWNFYSQSSVQAMHNLVWGGGLANKIHVPKGVFVLSAISVGLVNLVLALGPLALIMLGSGHPFTPALAFLPISILIVGLFTLGVGMFVAALAVLFVDVIDLYQFALSILMYLTPIFYPLDIVPAKYLPFMQFNPLYYMVEIFRVPIYQGTLPELSLVIRAALIALVALGIGWWFFTGKSDEFAYRT